MTIRTDELLNQAGDANSVPGNLEIKYQRKDLTAPITSSQTMTDLTFNNLVIGKTYRATIHAACDFTGPSGATEEVIILCKHNGNDITEFGLRADAVTTDRLYLQGDATTGMFVATATTLTFDASIINTSGSNQVSDFNGGTWAILEELPAHTVTTDFT
jgi:hypothetical protein